jgi:ATP-dependent RNA helicase DDX31/DBP7
MKKYRKDFDDPLQYHAKPKDLSKNSLSNPAEFINQQPSLNSAIFTSSTFSTYNLDSRLVSVLEKNDTDGGLSLTRTTSVQSAVIPTLLKRSHNIFIKSQTGSGKTLSYLIPVIQDLITLCPPSTRGDGTRALVIAPTRELCQQISDIVTKLTRGCVWIIGGCISGGEKRKSEKARLRKGITLLVGTPGRLLDHLKATESFNLTKLRWIILDEADRLLDMGLHYYYDDYCKHYL